MRVEGSYRGQITGYRAPAPGAAGGTFALEEAAGSAAAASPGAIAPMAGIEALLALQAADDPVRGKRKALRRGRALLETLDEVRADLLAGRLGEGRLNQLLALIGQARERTAPGLDAVIDDIELRVRVELAKLGRFEGS